MKAKGKHPVKKDREDGFRQILAEAVLTRALLFLIGLYAAAWIPAFTEYARNNFQYHQDSVRALDMWTRWDLEWYLHIADKGYETEGLAAHYQNATSGFFPLYPSLIRILGLILGNNIVAGLLISNAALVVFLWILMQLGKEQEIAAADRQRTAWFYLIFPTTFFLSAVFTESLYLALSAGSLLLAHKRRWWIAGLLGFFGVLCRPTGIFLLIPLLFMYMQETGFSLKNLKVNALALLMIPAGLALFAYYCNMKFGDPLAFYSRQSLWRQGSGGPWAAFELFFNMGSSFRGIHNNWADFAIAILALAALPLIFRRFGTAYGLYASAVTLVPLCSSLMSFQRLILVSFPHFMLLGSMGGNARANRMIQLLSIAGMALYFAIFSQWGWIG